MPAAKLPALLKIAARVRIDSGELLERAACGEDEVTFTGAVLVTVRGVAQHAAAPESPELAAALAGKPVAPRPGAAALASRSMAPGSRGAGCALVLAAGGAVAGGASCCACSSTWRPLGSPGQRMAAVAALAALFLFLLVLELPLMSGLLRYGRHLKCACASLPGRRSRLSDRYFQSRLKSDMAERSHGIHQIRHLSELGRQLTRAVFELLLTTAGIVWLDPRSAPWAIAPRYLRPGAAARRTTR